MMWLMGLVLLGAGMGACGTVLWTISTRRAAERQRMADDRALRLAQQQVQMTNMQLQRWQDTAQQRAVQLAYLHGEEAGRRNAEHALRPPVQVVDGYVVRPPVGREGAA